MAAIGKRRPVLLLTIGLAAVVVVARVVQARTSLVWNDDFHIYWAAARAALDGADPWVPGFVYLPAALGVLLPVGLLPEQVAGTVWLIGTAAAVAFAAAAVARRYAVGVPAVLLLTFLAFPTESALQFGNVTALQLPLLVGAVLSAEAGRWSRVGLLLGVLFVLKPVLLPCLLVVVLRRRWQAVGLALGVPLAASAGVLLVVGDPGAWYRAIRTGSAVAAADPASAGLATAPLPLAVVGAGALLAASVALATAWWVSGAARPPGVAVGLLFPLVALFLIGPVTWAHYPLLLLPMVAELWSRGGKVRVLAAAAVGCLVAVEPVVGGVVRAVPPTSAFLLVTASLALVAAAVVVDVVRRRSGPQPLEQGALGLG